MLLTSCGRSSAHKQTPPHRLLLSLFAGWGAPSLHTLHHVVLHLFVYLLGSLSPLSQPVEPIAGVQPVVGVVVLAHPVPVHAGLFLSSFCPLNRADLSPLWSSLSEPAEHEREEWQGRGRGDERGREGAQWCCHGSSCHQCLSGNQNSCHTRTLSSHMFVCDLPVAFSLQTHREETLRHKGRT